MKEKQWQGPGVFQGLSTTKAYKGKYITIRIDSKLAMEIDLETPLPTEDNVPGVDESLFFKQSLNMRYPEEAEVEVFVGE